MSRFARVESFQALQEFKVSLCKFAEDARAALEEAEGEIRRTMIWLKQDQHSYWKAQVRKRTELVARAKAALQQKRLQKTALGSKTSDVEERKALAAAVRQLEEAQQKLANVLRWMRQLEIDTFNFRGTVQGLHQAVEAGVPKSTGRLDAMIRALDSYAALAPPSERVPAELSCDEGAQPSPAHAAAEGLAADTCDETSAGKYQSLRTRTPPREVREDIPVTGPDPAWSRRPAIGQADCQALAALAAAGVPPGPDAAVAMAAGACEHGRLYFERLAPGETGRCVGYVGFVDDRPVTGHVAVAAADLLALRPDWTELVQLPPGWLVVLNGRAVEAVVDSDGRAVWSTDPREREG